MFNLFKKNKKDKGAELNNGSSENKKSNSLYFEAKVTKVVNQTDQGKAIYFELPEGREAYKPGQYITVIATIDGKEERRSYSFCTAYGVDQYAGIGVKRVVNGKMSNYLNDHIKEGDSLQLMAQGGNFTPAPKTAAHHYCLLSGGSGITPMLSMMKHLLKNESSAIISLVYANQNKDAVMFDGEIKVLAEQYSDRLSVSHVLDNTEGAPNAHQGLMTSEVLQNIIDTRHLAFQTETSYWICGPQGLMYVYKDFLSSTAVDSSTIFTESFVAAPKKETSKVETESKGSDDSYQVEIILDGDTHHVEVSKDASILETALDKGIDLPYSCQSGLCTACRGKCLSGEVEMIDQDGLSDEEIENGYVLTCVSQPRSKDIKIEIG